MLWAKDLVKVYANGVVALDRISFCIPEKSILVVGGPNGAGKTTLIRIVSTALRYTSGEVNVHGFDARKEAEKIRRISAVTPQESRPDGYMTPEQFVSWYLVSRGISISESKSRARHALELLRIDHVKDRKCLALSGGEMRRVMVATTIATQADLLILDEPVAGLDPVGRRAVYGAIHELSKDHDIIMSTHLIGETEDLAGDILLINKGQILACGSIKEFMRRTAKYSHTVIIDSNDRKLEIELDNLSIRFLREKQHILAYVRNSDQLLDVMSLLAGTKLPFSVRKISLDDIFVELVSDSVVEK